MVARDDDKSSLCSLPQLRFAIMENCRRAFRTMYHPFYSRAVERNSLKVPAKIAHSLRIKNRYFPERTIIYFVSSIEWKIKNYSTNFLNFPSLYLRT